MTVFNSNKESSNKVLMNHSSRGEAQLLFKTWKKMYNSEKLKSITCFVQQEKGLRVIWIEPRILSAWNTNCNTNLRNCQTKFSIWEVKNWNRHVPIRHRSSLYSCNCIKLEEPANVCAQFSSLEMPKSYLCFVLCTRLHGLNEHYSLFWCQMYFEK